MLVLDDGWFGKRDDDTTSLGDWIVDKRKFPHGLKAVVDEVNACGCKFGIWVEPEMVCQDSVRTHSLVFIYSCLLLHVSLTALSYRLRCTVHTICICCV